MPKKQTKTKESVKDTKKENVKDTVKDKEELVQVPKSTLEAIEKRFQDYDKKINILEKVADKGRIAALEEKNKDSLVKKVSLSKLGDKLVVGWKMTMDDVGFDEDGRMYSHQKIKLFLQDIDGKKSEKEINYPAWSRNSDKIFAEVIKENHNSEKGITYILDTDDFGEVEVLVDFVNPF